MNSAPTVTAEPALFEAYEEWRQIIEAAGAAIRAGNWSVASDCHKRISVLQPRITRLTNETRQEWQRAGAGLSVKERKLHAIVSGLIELELQNNSFLASAKQSARNHLDQLSRARQNLKRVHRSYSSVRPTTWNSFS
ncbi:MAG TPA: hypothetical protein VN873_17620 [Candidatus Angelobacter sp.]|nr:hypothetical protein [Candidatus Angelobacter sp.]